MPNLSTTFIFQYSLYNVIYMPIDINTKMFKGGDPANQANYLDCLPWTGYEKNTPVGYILPPGIKNITSFIKSVVILEAEVDEGFVIIKKKDVQPGDQIINVQLNENSLAAVLGSNGPDSEAIQLIDPVNGAKYTRLGWYNNHGQTDGLAMLAASRLIASLRGPGVHFGDDLK